MSAKLNKAIEAVDKLNSAEINSLVDAIKRRRTVLYAQAIGQFSKDDVVTFTAKTGEQVVGIVKKTGRKNVTVKPTKPAKYVKHLWQVPATMLNAYDPIRGGAIE
jgi:predicted XRE-type DNA-binding protein